MSFERVLWADWWYERRAVAVRSVACAAAMLAGALFAASTAEAAPSCGKVTAAMIKSTLGVAVGAPKAASNPPVLQCTYTQRGNPGHIVIVGFQTGMSLPLFAYERRHVLRGVSTRTYNGLGVPAFFSFEGTGSFRSSALVALKGATMLNVDWLGPIAKSAALMRKVLTLV